MGGVFGGGSKKTPQLVEHVTPPTVDNSEKVAAEERARKKRRGISSHNTSSGADLSGVNAQKKTLGQ